MTNEMLKLTGLVSEEITLDADMLQEAAHGSDTVSVTTILEHAEIGRHATHGTAISRDGDYRASIPLSALHSGGMLELALNGVPLAPDQGGPFRLRVVDGDTLCWNVKAVGEITLSAGPLPDDVPEKPTH